VISKADAALFDLRRVRARIAELQSKRNLKNNDYGFLAAKQEVLEIVDELIAKWSENETPSGH
jgi:hypothetical protein